MDERSSTPKKPRSGNKSPTRDKGHKDFNELAFMIAQKATGEIPKEEPSTKNPAAVTLGRLGGLKGGKARAEKLTPEERKVIAKKAADKRWAGTAFIADSPEESGS
ncbi:MAG TPA: hypothetical protein VM120_24110 [Bryobacteraceae bacterium]|nr:hypothetical protein [Bryobacteraceae bacterium]